MLAPHVTPVSSNYEIANTSYISLFVYQNDAISAVAFSHIYNSGVIYVADLYMLTHLLVGKKGLPRFFIHHRKNKKNHPQREKKGKKREQGIFWKQKYSNRDQAGGKFFLLLLKTDQELGWKQNDKEIELEKKYLQLIKPLCNNQSHCEQNFILLSPSILCTYTLWGLGRPKHLPQPTRLKDKVMRRGHKDWKLINEIHTWIINEIIIKR